MKSIIEDLQEQVEHWRQRAERAEGALQGRGWDTAVPPLTLYQTRLMRLLARQPYNADALAFAMGIDYEDTGKRSIYVHMHHIRRRLPAMIAPTQKLGKSYPYDVPDREALRAFLGMSLPEQAERRAAA